ncbi:Hpt domain-containing protein [uncultured Maritimibacter sp.]|jgi:HPt (histidine-containing phosphotransfer) domain-containing protein|uniref:Hpt domain-containing protein n=1 Tax=uncultured Maritimibacter sp. TaxID=991866 RepID=UPI00261DE0BD|nr:Hpt domain-containing protein [uncultured Maritimibacter sp.]
MIDWDRVAELRGEIGEDDFAEVIGMFLDEVEDKIRALRSNPDPATIEGDMHFIKSSALNIGFADLARVCYAGERAAAAGQSVDLAPVFATYDASRAAFMADAP